MAAPRKSAPVCREAAFRSQIQGIFSSMGFMASSRYHFTQRFCCAPLRLAESHLLFRPLWSVRWHHTRCLITDNDLVAHAALAPKPMLTVTLFFRAEKIDPRAALSPSVVVQKQYSNGSRVHFPHAILAHVALDSKPVQLQLQFGLRPGHVLRTVHFLKRPAALAAGQASRCRNTHNDGGRKCNPCLN